MNVYVESNFVLALALRRQESEHCRELLGLAEAREIHLHLPAFCIAETYEALHRRAKRRQRLREELSRELTELARSMPYAESAAELGELTAFLLRSGEEESASLDDTLESVLDAAEVIPIGRSTITAAANLQRSRNLSRQDAMVYASILESLAFLTPGPCCFVTHDARDFLNPNVLSDLTSYSCRLLTRFSDALGYCRSLIQQ